MDRIKNTYDFNDSLKFVSNAIGETISNTVHKSHKLKIHVNDTFEVVLTHYPLWDNENFLYMICNKQDRMILEKDVAEKDVADIINKIIEKNYLLN